MAAYTAGFMTHVTCRLTAKNRDWLRNPIRSVIEHGLPLPFYSHPIISRCSLFDHTLDRTLCLYSSVASRQLTNVSMALYSFPVRDAGCVRYRFVDCAITVAIFMVIYLFYVYS